MHTHRMNNLGSVSRRSFLRNGAVATIIAPTLSGWGDAAASKPTSFYNNPDFLNAAVETARWIRSAERQTDHGSYWLPEPDHPEKLTTVSPVNGIYSGSAGTVLFFLQVAKATGDAS